MCPCSHSTRGSPLLLTLQSCLLQVVALVSGVPWAILQVTWWCSWTLEAFGFAQSKKALGRQREGREDGEEQLRYWQITVLVQWLVSVHADTCSIADLNIFPPFLRKVLNFKPHVDYNSSLKYVTGCPFALLIILISPITECLSFGSCPNLQKLSARMRETSRILRSTDRVKP